MEGTVFAFSQRGVALAGRISVWLKEQGVKADVFAPPAYAAAQPGVEILYPDVKTCCAERFASCQLLIFVGAAGIAVRAIAPYIRSKLSDPAVLSVDEQGVFVIPLLSGHIGGANEWARKLAALLGATAAVTTATDRAGLFAVDEWAARRGMALSALTAAKHIAAALVGGRPVQFCTNFPVAGALPPLVQQCSSGRLGFTVTIGAADQPYDETLCLYPAIVHIGIGCRRGTAAAVLEEALCKALLEAGISRKAVKAVATIDLKAQEAGLLTMTAHYGWPLHCYSAAALQALPGSFSTSEFVRTITGIDNVCERAAVLSSGGQLVYKKHIINGVTVAIAIENYVCRF